MATYESKKYDTPISDATKIADGSVNNTEFQYINSLSSNAQTQITARLPLAGGTMTGDLNFGDNVDINFGAGTDLKILHDGSNSIIQDAGTGNLVVAGDNVQITNSAQSENQAIFTSNGAVELYHNNAKKIETSATGVTITGVAAATTVTGDGSGLTALNGSNISSGTVADARISTLTASKLTGALPAIDGSALTGIDVVPSGTDAVGAIKEFALYYKGSGTPSTGMTSSIGDTVTPSTYDTNSMYLGVPEVLDINFPTAAGSVTQVGQMRGFRGSSDPAGKTRGPSGTWRCLAQAKYTEGSSGGPSGISWHISLAGLFQRIS